MHLLSRDEDAVEGQDREHRDAHDEGPPRHSGLPTDLRAMRRRSERTLVIGVVIVFLGVGGLLIGLIYGWPALFTGLLCLIPGVTIFVVIWLLLRFLEWLSQRGE
jgi:fatty acid desaturase